jgi:aminoglycoside phosphotransferase (APT) family kinase protein
MRNDLRGPAEKETNPFVDVPVATVAADRGRDFENTSKRLAVWFSGKIGAKVELSNLRYPLGAGKSNETILCDASWKTLAGQEQKSFVIRMHPGSYQVFLDPAFERQYQLLDLIGKRDWGVRVPEMCWQELDPAILGDPFFVMSRVLGRVPVSYPAYNVSGWLAEATPARREHAWISAIEQFSAIHRIPTEEVQFLHRPQYGADGFEDEWQYWMISAERAAAGNMPPVTAAAAKWLTDNKPVNPDIGISWGDARIGNMMFDEDFNVAAVLDWEQASLAGPIQDLGWWLVLDVFMSKGIGVKRLDGLGNRQQTIDLWQELTGKRADNLEWFEAYASFKCAVLCMRMTRMEQKFMPANNAGNNNCTRWLANFLDLPQPKDMG